MAYLYEAYKLEQAYTISESAYLYEVLRIKTGLFYLWDDLSIYGPYELEQACTISEMAYLYGGLQISTGLY